MHLKLTPEALLKQLGYSVTDQNLEQIDRILKNTRGLEKFLPHIPSFADALAVVKGYIAMSNSVDRLKIKCDADTNANNLVAFTELVRHWADKYKLALTKADNKNTYYIIGHA